MFYESCEIIPAIVEDINRNKAVNIFSCIYNIIKVFRLTPNVVNLIIILSDCFWESNENKNNFYYSAVREHLTVNTKQNLLLHFVKHFLTQVRHIQSKKTVDMCIPKYY